MYSKQYKQFRRVALENDRRNRMRNRRASVLPFFCWSAPAMLCFTLLCCLSMRPSFPPKKLVKCWCVNREISVSTLDYCTLTQTHTSPAFNFEWWIESVDLCAVSSTVSDDVFCFQRERKDGREEEMEVKKVSQSLHIYINSVIFVQWIYPIHMLVLFFCLSSFTFIASVLPLGLLCKNTPKQFVVCCMPSKNHSIAFFPLFLSEYACICLSLYTLMYLCSYVCLYNSNRYQMMFFPDEDWC